MTTALRRDPRALAGGAFDVLVVGGGISGACILRDAAMRGLKAALVEQGDFGEATSSNSMRVIHGGLRYLQDADLRRVRRMIAERRSWQRIAPHQVHPLAFMLPTHGHGLRSRRAMAAALRLNDWLGFDRNRGVPKEIELPSSRVMGREASLGILPGLDSEGHVTGAALWYDAQIYNSEQLLFSILESAGQDGARFLNYVKAAELLIEDDRVVGVHARDQITGEGFDIRAAMVVNAAGPWADQLLTGLGHANGRYFRPSLAMNLVVPQLLPDIAVGLTVPTGSNGRQRTFFAVPWRGVSIIGTSHTDYGGTTGGLEPDEGSIERLLRASRRMFPGAHLQRDDVLWVHFGLLPQAADGGASRVDLWRQGRVIDHRARDGIEGLITAIGVKYTEARWLAERTVDLVSSHRTEKLAPCSTKSTPIVGGDLGSVGALTNELREKYPGISRLAAHSLVRTYGQQALEILRLSRGSSKMLRPVEGQNEVLRVEIVYAVRRQMAQHLEDVMLRRTNLASRGWPGEAVSEEVARIMAEELDWTESRQLEEISFLRERLRQKVAV